MTSSRRRPTLAPRLERDEIGELPLPRAALYGIQTARSCASLSFSGRSLGEYPALVRALAMVKAAAACANAEAGTIEAPMLDAIVAACRKLIAGECREDLLADMLAGGGSIAIHMNINEVIANLANEQLGGRRGQYQPIDPKRHVNASQSTADVCHTASRLAVLDTGVGLEAGLVRLRATLSQRCEELGAVPTLARTCLRDGLPTTVGILLGGHLSRLQRQQRELARSLQPLWAVTLGGTVIGTGEGAPPAYRRRVVPLLAEIAGRRLRRRADPAEALQNSDDLAGVSAQLVLLAESLLKLATDVRLLSSGPRGGFGELILPHVLQGSSFFVGKTNPVVPETMIQCCLQVFGCDRAVQAACERAELHLNVFDGLVVANVLDELAMLTAAVDRFDQLCLQGLEVDRDRCLELSRSVSTSAVSPPLRAARGRRR